MKLDLGCGRGKQSGYIGIDIENFPGVDQVADLTKGIPYPEDSVEGIYCSHFLEHLQEPLKLLNEIYRVCKHRAEVVIKIPLELPDPAHLTIFNADFVWSYIDTKKYEVWDWKIDRINTTSSNPALGMGRPFSYDQMTIIMRVKKNEDIKAGH